MRFWVCSFVAALLLAACDYAVQTTSGADYLARYDAAVAASPAPQRSATHTDTDALVREAAAVEPILTLPARFGLARIENGRLTAIPAAEAELWANVAAKHGAMGAFVPVSPLIAETTAAAFRGRAGCCRSDAETAVRTIRLGAARQHVEAVLIYEVGARARRGLTPLALMDLTIIGGYFLPTRSIKARGLATAVLLDVRNGYPYGSASAEIDLSGLSATWGKGHRTETLRERAALEVAQKLVPEVDAMLAKLAAEMRLKAATGS